MTASPSPPAIHPTAVVDPGARLAEGVRIGAFSVIDGHVELGAGTAIGHHVIITGHTRLGRNNRVYPFSCLGEAPQDKKYHGEPTLLTIGDNKPSASAVRSTSAPRRIRV
jgi:UDP-N-acetylglucosamine acyltransferase